MIVIDEERCTGCGRCVEACPAGALYLVDGKAVVDGVLCRTCPASSAVCLDACPNDAIALASQQERAPGAARVPALWPERRPEPEVVRVRAQPAAVPLPVRALPILGAALAWAGREILPWLAEILLDTRARRTTRFPATGVVNSSRGDLTPTTRGGGARGNAARGGGRQHRRRRRGK